MAPDIKSSLRNHERVKQLQSQTDDVTFSRMVLDIQAEDQADNFTVGTLTTENGFGSHPAVAISQSAKTVISIHYLGKAFTGHKGYVHGGAIATVLDECCGRAALCHFDGQKEGESCPARSAAVTAQLTVDYLAPIKVNSCVMIQATVMGDESSKRKAKVVADLWSLGQHDEDRDVLFACAQAVFIEPRNQKIA